MTNILRCALVLSLSIACGACESKRTGATDASTTGDTGSAADAGDAGRETCDACIGPGCCDRGDGGSTTLPPGVTPSPDGMGYCCPAGPPSCDCTPTGGFVTDPATCGGGLCDGHPLDWTARTDAHGCLAYDVGMTRCCGCPPEADAGP